MLHKQIGHALLYARGLYPLVDLVADILGATAAGVKAESVLAEHLSWRRGFFLTGAY